MRRRPALIVAAIVLVPLVSLVVPLVGEQSGAQGPPPLNQQFPGPLGNAVFGKVVAGEFTGDLSFDGVVMDGDEPVLVVAPEVFDSAVGTSTSADDIAVLSGVLPGKDLLLTVGNTGLSAYERGSGAESWLVTSLRDASTAWAGARHVRVGDVNGDGLSDLIGVAWNGTDVLVELGAGGLVFQGGAGFSSYGADVYDVVLLDWYAVGDDPGTDEIALLTDYGVEIYDEDGSYVDAFAWSASPMHAVAIDDAGAGVQRLALVTCPVVDDWFLVIGRSGSEGPYSLGPVGVVAMAAADADEDGDTEVFLSVQSEARFWMLEHLSPAVPSFDVGAPQKFAHGGPGRDASLNQAGLAPGDFDGDGALDVLAPSQGDLDGAITVYGTMDVVGVTMADPGSYRVGVERVTYLGSSNEVEVVFSPPAAILAADAGEETRLSVMVWRAPDLGEATIATHYHSSSEELPDPERAVRVAMPEGYHPATSTDVFSFVTRQVVLAEGDTVDIAPAMTGIYTPEPNWPTILLAPETLYGVGSEPETQNSSAPNGGGFGVGPSSGGNDPDSEPR